MLNNNQITFTMKNIIYLLITLISLSFQSCCEKCDKKHFEDSLSEEINELLNNDSIDISHIKSIKELYNITNKLDKGDLIKNYAIPSTIAKDIIEESGLVGDSIKSVFFNWKDINDIMTLAKKDPLFDEKKTTDTLGISIFYGKYSNSNLNMIKSLYRNINIDTTYLNKKNTFILHPTLLKQFDGEKDSLFLLSNKYNLDALNVGELCPPNCPVNSTYYKKNGRRYID